MARGLLVPGVMRAQTVKLHVGCDITVRAGSDCPIVAMLRPASGLAQWLSSETYAFDPWVPTTEHVDGYGNLCQRMVVPQGEMRLRVEATVETESELAVAPEAPYVPVDALPDSVLLYLLPSRYCPSDTLEPKAWQVVGNAAPGYGQAEAIRAWIHANLAYRYGTSDASTDASATLARGAGVCRDFAHVGIALTRALHIPARMVVGYLHGLEPMDLHAWFEAYVGGRWYTFDATQGQARGGRVVLAYGRDAADVAFISNYAPLETVAMKVWVEVAPPPAPLPPAPPRLPAAGPA
jgi:transglutaminase-like putative cysteine protease